MWNPSFERMSIEGLRDFSKIIDNSSSYNDNNKIGLLHVWFLTSIVYGISLNYNSLKSLFFPFLIYFIDYLIPEPLVICKLSYL